MNAAPALVALDIQEREAILRVLEDRPDELLELGATLRQGHVWREREGPDAAKGYTDSNRSSFALTAPGHRAGRATGGRA